MVKYVAVTVRSAIYHSMKIYRQINKSHIVSSLFHLFKCKNIHFICVFVHVWITKMKVALMINDLLSSEKSSHEKTNLSFSAQLRFS